MDIESITLNELITYSKQKNSPPVTIIDEVTKEELDYITIVAERLKLDIIDIADTNMVAVINDIEVATKLARDIKKKIQIMYYDLVKRPSVNFAMYVLTNYTPSWITIRDNGYIVKSYNADGEEIEQWINTETEDTKIPTLDGINKYTVSLKIRGRENNNYNNAILELSRYHFVNDGVFNEKRQSYYPKEKNTDKEIADYNRLEKLFKRWGFRSL